MAPSLRFKVIEGAFTICKLAPAARIPAWAIAASGGLTSITRTAEELSIVCPSECVPSRQSRAVSEAAGEQVPNGGEGEDQDQVPQAFEDGWAALAIDMGVLPFGLVGILAAALHPLAAAEIGIFAVSTFNTDVILVQSYNLNKAVQALEEAGHVVTSNDSESF